MRKEILIIGIGGQGIKTLAQIIAQAACYQKNLWPSCYSQYTAAARGGEIISCVVIADRQQTYSLIENPDIIVVFSQKIPTQYSGSRIHWIFDPTVTEPKKIMLNRLGLPNILKQPSANLVMLGVIQKLIPELTTKNTLRAMKKILGKNNFPGNKKIFEKGRKLVK